MKSLKQLLIAALFLRFFQSVKAEEANWTSKRLTPPFTTGSGALRARAVSQDGRGNLLVAVEKSTAGQPESSAALFKADPSGNVIWTVDATKAGGTPFDISLDPTTESAFVIVSESKRAGDVARGHVIQFTNVFATNGLQQRRIGEKVFFTTPGNVGVTKLFGCVRHPNNGDLYVTGGTSASLYRSKSKGKGDIIVVRLGPSGTVLASAQFGSVDNEVGRSIDINADGSALVAVSRRQFSSGLSTSEIYRLNPDDLSIVDGPHSPYNHGADPLFNPNSVAIVGPIASQPDTLVTFVSGDALVKPDRQADVYIHIYGNVADRVSEVSVAFDGAKNLKGIDSCVAIRIGSDGNAYCLGYTETDGASVSRSLHLIVVSPTGELLFKSERTITGTVPFDETPTGLTIMENGDNRTLAYVGHARVGGKTEPTIGFIEVSKGNIRAFAGFGDIVEGAGIAATPPGTSTSTDEKPSIAVIAGGAAGGLAVLAAVIAGFVLVEKRRRFASDPSMTRGPRSTKEYTREVEDSFSDAMTPNENEVTRGALV